VKSDRAPALAFGPASLPVSIGFAPEKSPPLQTEVYIPNFVGTTRTSAALPKKGDNSRPPPEEPATHKLHDDSSSLWPLPHPAVFKP